MCKCANVEMHCPLYPGVGGWKCPAGQAGYGAGALSQGFVARYPDNLAEVYNSSAYAGSVDELVNIHYPGQFLMAGASFQL